MAATALDDSDDEFFSNDSKQPEKDADDLDDSLFASIGITKPAKHAEAKQNLPPRRPKQQDEPGIDQEGIDADFSDWDHSGSDSDTPARHSEALVVKPDQEKPGAKSSVNFDLRQGINQSLDRADRPTDHSKNGSHASSEPVQDTPSSQSRAKSNQAPRIRRSDQSADAVFSSLGPRRGRIKTGPSIDSILAEIGGTADAKTASDILNPTNNHAKPLPRSTVDGKTTDDILKPINNNERPLPHLLSIERPRTGESKDQPASTKAHESVNAAATSELATCRQKLRDALHDHDAASQELEQLRGAIAAKDQVLQTERAKAQKFESQCNELQMKLAAAQKQISDLNSKQIQFHDSNERAGSAQARLDQAEALHEERLKEQANTFDQRLQAQEQKFQTSLDHHILQAAEEKRRLCDEHQKELDHLRMKLQKEQERLMQSSATATDTKALLDQVQQSAAKLEALQHHSSAASAAFQQAKAAQLEQQDKDLKASQEELRRKQSLLDQDRTELIRLQAQLEADVRHQQQHATDERRRLRQDAEKIAMDAESLRLERELFNASLDEERRQLDAARNALQEERKQALAAFAESRRELAEEKALVRREKHEHDVASKKKADKFAATAADIEAALADLQHESSSLEKKARQLELSERRISEWKSQFKLAKQKFQREKNDLRHLAGQVQAQMHNAVCLHKKAQQELRAALHSQETSQRALREVADQKAIMRAQQADLQTKEEAVLQLRLETIKHAHPIPELHLTVDSEQESRIQKEQELKREIETSLSNARSSQARWRTVLDKTFRCRLH
eukprot:TRINITY_DN11326_c0_g1_i2.p1 TRINITY_DN11326_c0_g1~~TRINITY_DN11326_c0_g1_i2.p1  ORF type:complete len:854 (+),score=155.23 TRINITY_DN11326_c0_g1_i2:170-2563(+)